jgi:tripartite ATP-independent transporter DctM subunit
MATLCVTGIFGAVCGSAVAAATTISYVSYPQMKKHNYEPSLASSVIATGSTMAIMIPPSIPMIVYAMIVNVSVVKLFFAGFGAGFFEILILCLTVFIMAKRKKSLAPVSKEIYSFSQKLRGLKNILPFVAIFLMVFGGLYGGLFTPTEAGAAGAMSSLLVCLVMKRIIWQNLKLTLFQTSRIMGQVIMILIGVAIFNTFVALSGVSHLLSDWVVNIGLSKTAFLFIVMILYLPFGCFIDELTVVLLTLPIFMPTLTALNVDLVHFGILLMLSWQISMITPPIGLITFVTKSAIPEVSLPSIFKGCLIFWFPLFAIQIMVLLWPEVMLFPRYLIK